MGEGGRERLPALGLFFTLLDATIVVVSYRSEMGAR